MAALRAGLAGACLLLCFIGGTALGLGPEWGWGKRTRMTKSGEEKHKSGEEKRIRMPKDGEELWNLHAGCIRPASDYDQPPSTASALAGRWKSDRKFYRNFAEKAKHSTWEVSTKNLPAQNKVIYFVNADGDLANCTRCMDCRLTAAARKNMKEIVTKNPGLEQVELVITSPMCRAMDTAIDAFPDTPVVLDARLAELAGVMVLAKGKPLLEARKKAGLLSEYMRLWEVPSNQVDDKKRIRTATHLMSPPAGDSNSSAGRIVSLRRLIQDELAKEDFRLINNSKVAAWEREKRFLHEQVEAEELPDSRFAAVINDLWQRPEQYIAVVSHSNLLHIGLGVHLREGNVTRREL